MGCFYPISAWYGEKNPKTGKRSLVFTKNKAQVNEKEMLIPCNKCLGCRSARAQQWAIRCYHESSLYRDNCFITMTYDEKHLPIDGSLSKRDFQLFMKNLRKNYPGKKIRYFMSGEYGDRGDRPHYHAALFNHTFDDKIEYKSKDGVKLYISDTLNKIWGKGYCVIGEMTFASANYIAKYIIKKVSKDFTFINALVKMLKERKVTYDELEILVKFQFDRAPVFSLMSRGGRDNENQMRGIGYRWYEKYKEDIHRHDHLVINGRKSTSTKYYDNLLQEENQLLFEKIKKERMDKADYIYSYISRLAGAPSTRVDNTEDRLRVKEDVAKDNYKKMKRGYESNLL
ncbi:MAG: replication initiator protein [Arizlama microvirus]|nr:MAG: replication initiator protein [Arizlama microvirus]